MWFKKYRDYPPDESLVKEKVEPGKGIIGCEMHDINGWGESLHQYQSRKKGFFKTIFKSKTKNEPS
ncbi:MAG: hypothetical protein Q8K60_08455 [Parachlamydiaceae bacterium]|nr:hypothetical protein [Parachlamydiaceae bacterium]